ncbi:MAG: efflux RND transporter periplasmic adaptor subunit [Acidobacteria bacterium]|nr:efflux RND transporter periplasmic adaptor subunit [Acidobacteriota bacterium]MBV9478505.1 efflux RND transporter periplasmic adaptor subunit [Acidobacteriota bacterium]
MKQKCVLVLLALVLASCKRAAPQPAADNVAKIGANDYVIARRERITTGPTLSGNLSAQTEANVRAEVAGPLVDVRVNEGERVTKGELLARIGPGAISAQQSSQASAIASLRNNVALAEKELARQQSLFRSGIVAKATVDAARAQVDAARAQLAQAQAQSATTNEQSRDTTVEAPLSGVVTKRWVSQGDVVQVGATLYTIIDPSEMQLEAAVAADSLQDLRVGTPIEFQVQGFDGKVFGGRIARVNPEADPTTRQIKVFAEIPNNGGALASGLFAQGRLQNLTRIGVIVPAAAIDHRMTTPAVTRVRNGVVEHFDVVLGVVDDQNDRVEIRQGVNEGDILLVGAAQQLAPGTRAEVPAAAQQAGDAAK